MASAFPIPVLAPLGLGAAVSMPMAGALVAADGGAVALVSVGLATYAITLAMVWRLRPGLLRMVGVGAGIDDGGGRP